MRSVRAITAEITPPTGRRLQGKQLQRAHLHFAYVELQRFSRHAQKSIRRICQRDLQFAAVRLGRTQILPQQKILHRDRTVLRRS